MKGAGKTNAMRILEVRGIPFSTAAYPCAEPIDGVTVAERIGAPVETVYKTLVTCGKTGAYIVFIVPAAAELDLKKAAAAAGEKSVVMIPVKEITPVTGYVRGGCSPVGMKKQYATYIDGSAKGKYSIYVSAGRLGEQLKLSPNDIIAVTGGQYADLAI